MILRNACVEPQILHMMVCAPPIRCCFVTIKIYACIFMLILFSYCIFFLFSSGYCLCSSMFFVAIHEFASAFSPCYHQFFRRSQTPVMGPEPDFFFYSSIPCPPKGSLNSSFISTLLPLCH